MHVLVAASGGAVSRFDALADAAGTADAWRRSRRRAHASVSGSPAATSWPRAHVTAARWPCSAPTCSRRGRAIADTVLDRFSHAPHTMLDGLGDDLVAVGADEAAGTLTLAAGAGNHRLFIGRCRRRGAGRVAASRRSRSRSAVILPSIGRTKTSCSASASCRTGSRSTPTCGCSVREQYVSCPATKGSRPGAHRSRSMSTSPTGRRCGRRCTRRSSRRSRSRRGRAGATRYCSVGSTLRSSPPDSGGSATTSTATPSVSTTRRTSSATRS